MHRTHGNRPLVPLRRRDQLWLGVPWLKCLALQHNELRRNEVEYQLTCRSIFSHFASRRDWGRRMTSLTDAMRLASSLHPQHWGNKKKNYNKTGKDIKWYPKILILWNKRWFCMPCERTLVQQSTLGVLFKKPRVLIGFLDLHLVKYKSKRVPRVSNRELLHAFVSSSVLKSQGGYSNYESEEHCDWVIPASCGKNYLIFIWRCFNSCFLLWFFCRWKERKGKEIGVLRHSNTQGRSVLLSHAILPFQVPQSLLRIRYPGRSVYLIHSPIAGYHTTPPCTRIQCTPRPARLLKSILYIFHRYCGSVCVCVCVRVFTLLLLLWCWLSPWSASS